MKPTTLLPDTAAPDALLTVEPLQHRITCQIDIACCPATLYAIWADVEHWHDWDPDTRWAYLDAPFAVGSQGRIAPNKGFSVKMLISEATPHQSFTVTSTVLGSVMLFEHRLEQIPGGVRATHCVEFKGWLAGLLMKTVGKDVVKGLPVTMGRLKTLCESRSFAAT